MEIARNTFNQVAPERSFVKLHVLFAGLQSGVTERYANLLRESGTAIASTHVDTIGEVETALQSSLVDLVLCNSDNDALPLDQVISVIQQNTPDALLIVAGDSKVLDEHAFGIADIVDLDDQTRTLHRLNRTIQYLLKDQKLRTLEKQKESFEKRCLMLMDSSREAICYTHEGMHVFANPSYLELFGISAEDDEIETVTLMDLVEADFHKDLKRMLKLSQQANEKEYSLEVNCKRLDDSVFTADMTFSPVLVDEEASVQIIVRHKESESATAMPNIDLLTGLYSSNYFQGCASEVVDIAAETGKTHALFYIAIDKYMQMRETVGLTRSNAIIKQIADLFIDALGPEIRKTLSRIGDHAFAFIMPVKQQEHVRQIARKLVDTINQHQFDGISDSHRPTINVGITLSNHEKISDGSDFIDLAYHAYTRVADSDSNISIYGEQAEEKVPESSPEPGRVGSEDADSVDLVNYALDNGKISSRFIALLSLANVSKYANYYLEPQFQDDSGKLTPYDDISEAIAGSGKSAAIDSLIIKQAADMLRHEEFATHVFHIPLSAASFCDEGFIDRFSTVIKHFDLKPGNFSFVITGKDARQNLAQARDFCTRIKELGCSCYISRFAEGDDDIALVREIPASGIWFSSKLSEGFSSNENKLQRLKDLGNVMKSSNMKTILGNIHSPSDLANAWGIGVDFITGPFLHKGSAKPDFDFSRYT